MRGAGEHVLAQCLDVTPCYKVGNRIYPKAGHAFCDAGSVKNIMPQPCAGLKKYGWRGGSRRRAAASISKPSVHCICYRTE